MVDNARGAMKNGIYIDDNGASWGVEVTENIFTAGGFGLSGVGVSPFPKHCKMRHVGLLNTATGRRHSCPIASASDAHYKAGGTMSLGSKSCEITGRIGEHWRL